MRKFNENEKKFFKELTKNSKYEAIYFINFLNSIYFTESKSALILDHKNNGAKLLLNINTFENSKKRKNELAKLIEIILLCSYLKENRYISLIPAESKTQYDFLNKDFLQEPVYDKSSQKLILNIKGDYFKQDSQSVFDKDNNEIMKSIDLETPLYNLFKENLYGVLFVTEELKDYVENNFRTKEERNFIFTQIITIISILVALIIGLVSLFSPNKELNEINQELKKIHFDIHQKN